jgi:sugar porter (SP) family MFS transporter
MGRRDDARASLTRLEGPETVDAGISVIEQELEVEAREGQATWAEVFSVRLRKPIMIGIGLAILQQVTGINAIIYYANSIFEAAGFTTAEAQAKATLYAIGLVNFLATFIAIAWIDRFGRRPLLFAGLTGMGVSLFLVAVSFAFFAEAPEGATSVTPGSILTLVALVAFIASFAFSMGPVVWTIISEIYPNRVRGRAIAVATAFNWLAAFLVAQFFLSVVNAIGEATTFLLFAIMCVVSIVFVQRLVPETRGRSLEEIQSEWEPARH